MVFSVDVAITGGGGGGGNWRVDVFTPTNGQTLFTLAFVPTDHEAVTMFVNDAIYALGTDFGVIGNAVTWNNVEFVMQNTDNVIIHYLT